jgi:ABC-2 type transport system permease protein
VSTPVRVLRAEWTKLWTVRSHAWLLLGAVAVMMAVSTLVVWSLDYQDCALDGGACDVDTTRLALSGTYAAQVAMVALGALAVTSEYATGTIRTTLAAVPRRPTVFLAKAVTMVGPVLGAAIVGVGGCLLVERKVLSGQGFTAAHGYPALSLADGPTLRAAAGTAVYLGLVAALSFGVGHAVRDTAAALSVLLTLLFAFPILAALVTEPRWHEFLTKYSPMTAGLVVQMTKGLDAMPVGPWEGLSVLAAYAGSAMVVGGLAFRFRDA